jgi:hypothetical protein
MLWSVDRVILQVEDATAYTIRARSADNFTRELASDSGAGFTDPVDVAGPFELLHDERLEVLATGTVPSGGWWVRVYAKVLETVPSTADSL